MGRCPVKTSVNICLPGFQKIGTLVPAKTKSKVYAMGFGEPGNLMNSQLRGFADSLFFKTQSRASVRRIYRQKDFLTPSP